MRYNFDEEQQRWYIEWEADNRHAQIVLNMLGLTSESRGLSSPGTKERIEDEKATQPLDSEATTLYRSATMRLNFVAQDRPDLMFVTKELARSMQAPTQGDWNLLKHVGRYLITVSRLAQRFYWQKAVYKVTQYVDSDHAGCKRTRKSTSCGIAVFGEHMWRAYSSTQKIIATSSAESEFYSAVTGAQNLIGMVSLAADLGFKVSADLGIDSSAAKAILQRRGISKLRHLHTKALWVQQSVANKVFDVFKKKGTENPADLGTKFLDGNRVLEICKELGFCIMHGVSKLQKGLQ